MRVCLFTRAVLQQGKGGMEDHIAMLCEGLARKKIDVSVITTAHPQGIEEEKKNGVSYYYVPGSRAKKYSGLWWKNSVKKFLALHSQKPFDIAHSQSAGGFGFASENAGKRLGVPMVTSLHGTTHDELQTQFRHLKSISGIRSFTDFAETMKAFPKIAMQLHSYFFIDSKYLSGSELIIATSNEQKKTIMDYFGIPEKKIRLVYNSIDESLFCPMERYLAVQKIGVTGSPIFLCVARLEREKGVQTAILAVHSLIHEYPGALLVVVGDGGYRQSLEALARQLGVHHNVKFTGFVEFNSLPLYFNACDIFLNPTVRQDGYDLTVLEAMSCQKPVIASNIGSMPTAISHGKDGILIKPGSVQDLAIATESLLKDREKMQLISKNAREKILQTFSCESMVSKTISVYKDAIFAFKRG